jgi:hypothetical protein
MKGCETGRHGEHVPLWESGAGPDWRAEPETVFSKEFFRLCRSSYCFFPGGDYDDKKKACPSIEKEGKNMKRNLRTAVLTLMLGMSWLFLGAIALGANPNPVIKESFAAKEIRSGDTWKIYLKASDPAGKMKYIYATIDQAGGFAYELSRTRIKSQNAKELSGYIYLFTPSPGQFDMNFQTLTLTVHIGDGSGNFSNAAVFPLTFQARAKQEPPPPGVYKEEDLGPIMIQLYPSASDNGDESYH